MSRPGPPANPGLITSPAITSPARRARRGHLTRAALLPLGLLTPALLGACGPAARPPAAAPGGGAASPQRIRIAYLKWGLLPAVKSRGALERALATDGVSVEWVGPFPNFSPLLEAINAGSAELSAGGDIPALSGLAGQVPVCFLGVRPPQVQAEAILVRKNSPISGVADLVGKKVAVNRGGWGEDMLLRALDNGGVPRDRVERVYLAPGDALPAFAQGQVDAWAVWDPYVAIAEVEHEARRIASGDVSPHYGVYVVRSDFLKAHGATVDKVLTVLRGEGEWATSNPKEMAGILGKELNLSGPISQRMAEHLPGETIVSLAPNILADLQNAANWLHEGGAIPRKVDVASAVCPVAPASR